MATTKTTTEQAAKPTESLKPEAAAATSTGWTRDLVGAAVIDSLGEGFMADLEQRISARIKQEVEKRSTIILVRSPGKKEDVRLEHSHEKFPTLLQLAALRENILMVGPSGSSKTTSARQVSKALQLPFETLSLGPTITETRIFGYMNVEGGYVATPFRRVYENGGVFLFDEFDNGNPLVLTSINSALESGVASFPDRLVERHPDAVFICTANTWGRGADRLYVGRNQLDAATLERFATLAWDYDEDLERQLADHDDWVDRVQAIRGAIMEKRIAHIVSPRASIKGARLLREGFDWEEVEAMLVWKGLDADVRASVDASLEVAVTELR